jgi:sugar phosphate isomerase/epimerase
LTARAATVTPATYSVCQNILPNASMADDLKLLVSAGVRAIGLTSEMVAGEGVRGTVRLLHEHECQPSSLIAALRILDGTRDTFAEAVRGQLAVAAALGAPEILVVSGPLRRGQSTPEADAEVRTRLHAAGPPAVDLGVSLGLEPLHPFLRPLSYVHTVRHAARIVDEIPHAALVLDTAHTYWDANLEQDIRDYSGLIASVHLSDLSREAMSARRWERVALGSGDVPVADLIHLLDLTGYRGYFENEVIPYVDRPFSPERVERCLDDLRQDRAWFESRSTRGDAVRGRGAVL